MKRLSFSSRRNTWLAVAKALEPYWLLIPLLVGAIVFAAAVVFAPKIKPGSPPTWLTILLPALAATTVTALALADVRPESGTRLSGLSFAVALLGATVSLLGVITSLPAWLYKFLFGLGCGACAEAIVLTALSKAKTFRLRQQEAQARNLEELERRDPPT